VIKHGAEGAVACSVDGGFWSADAPPVHAVDTSGAGDASWPFSRQLSARPGCRNLPGRRRPRRLARRHGVRRAPALGGR
jgi:hypothetical protein